MPSRFLGLSPLARTVKVDLEGVPQIPDEYLEIMERPRKNRLNKEQRAHCDRIIASAKAEIDRRVLSALKKQGQKPKIEW